jgi:hypothetical protein
VEAGKRASFGPQEIASLAELCALQADFFGLFRHQPKGLTKGARGSSLAPTVESGHAPFAAKLF